MTAIAALTVADGLATPANHTFDPVTIENSVAWWADRSGGVALGFSTISYSIKAPKNRTGSRNYRLIAKVVLPVLEQVSGSANTGLVPAPTKAYDMIANVEMILPERSTLQQRKDVLAYVKNFLASSVITGGVNNFEQVF